MADQEEVLAEVSASMGRRFLGIVSLAFLAFLLIYIALFEAPAFGWRIFLLVFGAGMIWVLVRLHQATSQTLLLTSTEIRDNDGVTLAQIKDIRSLDRSMFAFKPSNGFLITLKTPGSRIWRPGMWWRFGRRVGVGGMTPGSQTKFMAEMVSAMLAERDGST